MIAFKELTWEMIEDLLSHAEPGWENTAEITGSMETTSGSCFDLCSGIPTQEAYGYRHTLEAIVKLWLPSMKSGESYMTDCGTPLIVKSINISDHVGPLAGLMQPGTTHGEV
jgi:hypothetical protein